MSLPMSLFIYPELDFKICFWLALSSAEHAEGLVIPSKEGLPIETAPLKWCTPKSSVVELHNCSAAYRICPVDVNSRPSSCLTNFLIGGRAVMLEQPRKSGTKVISHMLAAHGGEIFLHSIPSSRSILEDPPSIRCNVASRTTGFLLEQGTTQGYRLRVLGIGLNAGLPITGSLLEQVTDNRFSLVVGLNAGSPTTGSLLEQGTTQDYRLRVLGVGLNAGSPTTGSLLDQGTTQGYRLQVLARGRAQRRSWVKVINYRIWVTGGQATDYPL
ncbi:protein asunder homolog [Plakobranchus ocellatus]|uniref:Protein asunder homolog n=1 Tax=Plakobranchus ocellatus TaxID=259542 RepID=A0AAV3YQA8_9GAST|nr:protein asunder homolog [Plakobranchus ocellatus]